MLARTPGQRRRATSQWRLIVQYGIYPIRGLMYIVSYSPYTVAKVYESPNGKVVLLFVLCKLFNTFIRIYTKIADTTRSAGHLFKLVCPTT